MKHYDIQLDYDGRNPATPSQLQYIAMLSMKLHIPEPKVQSSGEAGRLIRELKSEMQYRKMKIGRK